MRRWLALIGVLLLSLPQVASAQGLVTLASFESPPYTGEHLEKEGIITQIVREAYARVGYQVSIRYHSPAGAMDKMKAGDLDGLAMVRRREDHKEWVLYSDPMPGGEVVFYKRKGLEIPFDGQNYDALGPYLFGTRPGYADYDLYPPVLRNQTRIRVGEDDLQLFRKLAAEEVDLVIVDKFIAQFLLNTQLPELADALDWIPSPISIDPNYLGISRTTPRARELLEDFNRGLAMLTEEGRIQAILAAHGLRE